MTTGSAPAVADTVPPSELPARRANRLILLLSRLFRIDASYFLKAGVWIGASYATYMLFRFIEMMGFVRLTTPEVFGQYQFIVALLNAVVIFSLPGVDEAILQNSTRGYGSALKAGTRIRLWASLVGAVALVIVAAYLHFVRPEPYWWLFLALAAIFPLYASYGTHAPYLMGQSRFETASKRAILLGIANLLVTLVVLYATRDLVAVVLSTTFVAILGHQVYYRLTLRRVETSPRVPGLARQGAHYTFLWAFDYLAPHVDKLVVTFFLGFGPFALYFVSVVFATQMAASTFLVKPLLLHKFARPDANHAERLPGDVLRVFLATLVLVGLGALLAPFFVPLLFTAQYAAAVPYTQLSLVYVAFAVPSILLQTYLQARGRTGALYSQRLIAQAVNIALLLVLVPTLGILGAVLSRVLTGVVALALLLGVLAFERRVGPAPQSATSD